MTVAACSDSGQSPTPGPTGSASPAPAGGVLPEGSVTFFGANAGDRVGSVITGDFNGDDAIDVVIGATLGDGPDEGRTDAGEVYVFLGPFAPGDELDAAGGDQDATLYGAVAGDNLGRALAAGDFNADGVDDLAVGAPAAHGSTGEVYVMFGGDLPEVVDFRDEQPDVLITGESPEDFAGIALASGDIGSDGRAVLGVGSILADGPDDGRQDAGAIYVFRGEDLSAGETIPTASAPIIVHGAAPGEHLGEALAFGDYDGDGADDLIAVATFSGGVGNQTPGVGRTHVLLSPLSGVIDLATQTGSLYVDGMDEGDQLGHSIAVGDVDGDGKDDIWLGAVSADGPDNISDLSGEAMLVPGGQAEGPPLGVAAIVYGPQREARLGRSATVGDLDGDGLAEMVMSAPNVDLRAGAVFIFRGGEVLPDTATEADAILEGLDRGDLIGHESFGIPSMDVREFENGGPMILVSAQGADGPDNSREDAGEVYLVPGSALFD